MGHFRLNLPIDLRQYDAFRLVGFQNLVIDLLLRTALLDLGLYLLLHLGNEYGAALRKIVPKRIVIDLFSAWAGNGSLGNICDAVHHGLSRIQHTEIQISELNRDQQPQGYQQPCSVDQPAADLVPEQKAQKNYRKDQHRRSN